MRINSETPKITLKGTLLIVCILTCSGLRLEGGEWRIETVDPNGGKFSSLRFDAAGNAHVAYLDDSQNVLKYGFRDHKLKKWFTSTLDGSAGFCSLTLDSKQRPHISYLDYGHGKLKYARWTGSSWEKQTLQINAREINYYTSITLDAKDNPRISYYEYWGAGDGFELHLRTVTWNGQFWGVTTIDPTPGSGKFNFMVTDSTGRPQVAYANVKSENASLRYAKWNGTDWDIALLEGLDTSHPVYSVAMALDKTDTPHIAYTDLTDNIVKYATRQAGKWQIQAVGSVVDPAYPDRNGIAIDSEGNPYISYFDTGTGVLKVAYRRKQKWFNDIVDQNFAGFTSSLQIAGGFIWLTYSEANGRGLKFAYKPLDSGEQSLVSSSMASVAK